MSILRALRAVYRQAREAGVPDEITHGYLRFGPEGMTPAARQARAAADNYVLTWHGTPDRRGIDEINRFETPAERAFREGYADNPGSPAYFFADQKRMADSYADDRRAWDYQGAQPDTIRLYVRADNPAEIDMGGQEWRGTRQMIADAQAGGRDGAVIRNVRDHYQGNERSAPGTVRVVFDSSQIRKPEATFDPARRRWRNLLAGAGGGGLLAALAARDQGEF